MMLEGKAYEFVSYQFVTVLIPVKNRTKFSKAFLAAFKEAKYQEDGEGSLFPCKCFFQQSELDLNYRFSFMQISWWG